MVMKVEEDDDNGVNGGLVVMKVEDERRWGMAGLRREGVLW
mgnify:CR=1 FL=1